jgi:hypothetical protein
VLGHQGRDERLARLWMIVHSGTPIRWAPYVYVGSIVPSGPAPGEPAVTSSSSQMLPAGYSRRADGNAARWQFWEIIPSVMDNHDAAAPPGDPTDQLWVVAIVGRLAGQGLLERPADGTDAIAVAGQRLLIAAGLLDTDPFGPAERLRSLLPAGAPLTAMSWFVREPDRRPATRTTSPAPARSDEHPHPLVRRQDHIRLGHHLTG